MKNVLTVGSAMFMAAFIAACGAGEDGFAPGMGEMAEGAVPVTTSLPPSTFHHIHINSVDPEASLDWWKTVWPAGASPPTPGMPHSRRRTSTTGSSHKCMHGLRQW